MKETVFNLSEEKQARIMNAVLEEFSLSGYEKTSLDTIVRKAGISKDGLFRYALDYAYSALNDYIRSVIDLDAMPGDPIERTRRISAAAVEFYIASPVMISFIVRSSRVEQTEIRNRVESVFDSYFRDLYSTADFSRLSSSRDDSLSLLKWLLVKTRDDFSRNLASTSRPSLCRDSYLQEWNFFLTVLTKGMYAGGGMPSGEKDR
ncbi:MAG TPA: TetR/AcrR family transcriptional regulator [Treponemataceae bacterium]|nr:TetR/AcrR family transcriptional regulator [Treponemataceae bacterium]